MLCEGCGSKLLEKAKFCVGCGTPAPKKKVRVGTHLTTDVLLDHLHEGGEDLGELQFRLICTFGDNREQAVFALVNIDEDGDTEFDNVTLFSYFAPKNFNFKKAVAAVQGRRFGVTNDGGNGGFQLVTSLRIETLTSVESFDQYVFWIGGQADAVEEELTGSDIY